MSLQKFKSDSHCVGGRHRSSTINIYGDSTLTVIKYYWAFVQIQIKKSMAVSDNTIQAEGLSRFFKSMGMISANAGKKLATNLFKTPSRALQNTSNIATSASTKSPKAALSLLPEVTNFYHAGRGFYLPRFAYYMLYERNKSQIDFILQHHLRIMI